MEFGPTSRAFRFVAIVFAFLFLLESTHRLFCQEKKEEEKKELKTDSWIVLPLAYYTPETSLAFGAAAAYYFRPHGADLKRRPSVLQMTATVTTKKQWEFIFFTDIYLKSDDYRIQGLFTINRWVDKFYGIGPQSLADDEENYTSRTTNYYLRFQKKVLSSMSLALQHEYQHHNLVRTESGGLLEEGQILGLAPFKISGFTLLANWDSRDNLFYPVRGSFHEASASIYRRKMGSDYNFDRYKVNLRTYIPVYSSHILALQGFFNLIDGEVPFQMMSFMGGPVFMRGYYKGRYRDKHALIFQADYRVRIGGRWGVVGFVSLGDVAEKLRDFNFMKFKAALGAGVRFALNPKEKINLRFDLGFSRESVGVYFTASEAF